MHLQDARCMNSFSSRSAGRLLCHFGEMEEARGPHKHHAPAQVIRLGSEEGPAITRGSLHPHNEVRLGIMDITGDVPPAGRSFPATIPRNPCGTA